MKGCYTRPLEIDGDARPAGGGRVTELTARPLLNALWPELAGCRPAARRRVRRPAVGSRAGAVRVRPTASRSGCSSTCSSWSGSRRWPRSTSGVRRHASQGDEALGRDGRAGRVHGARAGPAPRAGERAGGLLTQFRHDGSGFVPRSSRRRRRRAAADGRPWPSTAPARAPGWPADPTPGPRRPRPTGGSRGPAVARSRRRHGRITACRSAPPARPCDRARGRRPPRRHRGGPRAHPRGLPSRRRDRRGRRRVRRADDPRRRAGLRARPADPEHLERPRRGLRAAPERAGAVPLRRPPARGAAAGGPTTRSGR